MARRDVRENATLPPAIGSSPDLRPATIERAELRTEYFGLHAAAMGEVRGFRSRVIAPQQDAIEAFDDLGPHSTREGSPTVYASDGASATVSARGATRLLSSPAAAVLTLEDFEKYGVPLFDHGSSLISLSVDYGSSANWTFRFEVSHQAPIMRQFAHPFDRLRWYGHEPPVYAHWQGSPRPDKDWPALKGSVLCDLEDVGVLLSERFPWEPRDAAWFVLTGDYPRPPLVATEIRFAASADPPYTDAKIKLTVDATVSPEEVASHYARIRAELLGAGRLRRAEERTLEVFRFTTARRVNRPTVSWSELVREWDRTHPDEWSFEGNERAFRVYWRRGLHSVFPEMSLERVRRGEGHSE